MEQTKEEKDISVIIDDKLTCDQHITEKVNISNSILDVIRSFEHLDIKIVRLLYTSLVRPHSKSAYVVWNPYKKKHIDTIENVQRLVPGLFSLDHESRLESLNLLTLTYRSMRGIQNNNRELWFWFNTIISNEDTKTSGNSMNIYKRPRLNLRKYTLSYRTVDIWNRYWLVQPGKGVWDFRLSKVNRCKSANYEEADQD